LLVSLVHIHDAPTNAYHTKCYYVGNMRGDWGTWQRATTGH